MVSDRQKDAMAISGLAALSIVFFRGVLRGHVLVPWDVLRIYPPWQPAGPVHNALLSDPVRLYAPWRTLLGESLRHGKLPFWDPYVFGGAPFLANSQAAILYPPNFLYGVLPVDAATTVLVVLHVWLAMVGMYLLARYSGLRLGLVPAALAAVGFGFCGFSMVWAEFPTFAAVYAWLPWMILALFRLMDRPRPFAFVGLALSVAMAALGGHAQIFQYAGLALVLVIVVVGTHGVAASPRRGLGHLAAAIGGLSAGLLLAAPQLLATLEAAPLIVRGKEPIEGLVGTAFPLHLLPLIALPRAYGESRLANWFAPGNENEYVAFCGVIVLLLAPLSLRHWRRIEVQALLGVEALAWAIALGTPIFRVLYRVVPTMNQARGIGRATSLHSFALPLLAAVGLEVLLGLSRDSKTRRWAVVWVIGAIAIVGALLLIDHYVANHRFTQDYMIRQYVALVVPTTTAIAILTLFILPKFGLQKFAFLLPLLLAGELYMAYGEYNTADPGPNTFVQPNPIVEFLRSHPGRFVAYKNDEITGNTPIAYMLSTLGGSDTYILRDYADYFNLIENHEADLHLNAAPPIVRARALGSPLLANAGVRWVVSQEAPPTPEIGGPDVPPNPPLALVFRAAPNMIYATQTAFPLLRQLFCLQSAASEAEVITDLGNSPTSVYTRGVTADRVPADAVCPTAGVDLTIQSVVSSITIAPDGSSSAVVDGGKPRTIMYAETFYPGWIAHIDGRPAHLIRVDHAFMGVVVPAGRHQIDFSYHPTHLRLGISIAACATAAVLLVAFAGALLRHRRSRQASKPALDPVPPRKAL